MKSKFFIYVSIGFYVISLLLPIYSTSDVYGYLALIIGWITLPTLDFLCWISNFILMLVWFIAFKNIQTLVLTILVFCLMILFAIDHYLELQWFQIRDYSSSLIGYWFWLASSIFMIIYHFYPIQKNINQNN